MTSRGTKMPALGVMALVMMSVLWGGAVAQTACTTALVSLAPCLNYISGSSSTPSSSCCTQLSSVVQSQPQCLCQALSGQASSLGVTINQAQALKLPSACKVQTPPVSRCNAGNQPSAGPAAAAATPVESPTGSPDDADSDTPDHDTPSTVSSTPSAGAGSKSSPGSTSDAKMTKTSIHLTLFLLLVASSASSIIRN